MAAKKYSSYTEIDQELEILKLEKEINYNRIKLSLEKTKESIIPSKAVSIVGNLSQVIFSGTYGSILKMIIPYVISWYINKKRGN